jgi:hypothetical protein
MKGKREETRIFTKKNKSRRICFKIDVSSAMRTLSPPFAMYYSVVVGTGWKDPPPLSVNFSGIISVNKFLSFKCQRALLY